MIALALAGLAFGQEPTITRFGRGFTNVWLVRDDDSAILIDAHYPSSDRWLARKIRKAGLQRLDAVIVTHAHADHAGGAPAVHAAFGAPIVLGQGDLGTAASGHNPPIHPTNLMGALVKPTVKQRFPPFTPDVAISEATDLAAWGIAGSVLPLGGHTPGSLVVRLEGGQVFVGDLVRGRLLRHHRPTEHFFEPDVDAVHAILRQILADGAVDLYPGHGDVLSAAAVSGWLDRKDE